MNPEDRIAALKAELKTIEHERKVEEQRQRELWPPVYKYTITPISPAKSTYYQVYDDQVTLYELAGVCVNKEQCERLGHHRPFEGGMVYCFNEATGMVIMGVGGGSIHVGGKTAHLAFADISRFIRDNEDGGDITQIVNRHKERERKAEAARRNK